MLLPTTSRVSTDSMYLHWGQQEVGQRGPGQTFTVVSLVGLFDKSSRAKAVSARTPSQCKTPWGVRKVRSVMQYPASGILKLSLDGTVGGPSFGGRGGGLNIQEF